MSQLCYNYIRHRALARLVCLRRWGGGEGLEVVSLSLKGAPPPPQQHLPHHRLASDFVLFLRRCFWSSNLEKMELPGTAGHAIRSCLCMFWRGRTFSINIRKCPEIDQKGSHFGTTLWPGNRSKMLKIGAWGIRGAESRGRERFGMQNGGERTALGSKMEGKTIDLGARWRVRRLRIGYAAPGGACR